MKIILAASLLLLNGCAHFFQGEKQLLLSAVEVDNPVKAKTVNTRVKGSSSEPDDYYMHSMEKNNLCFMAKVKETPESAQKWTYYASGYDDIGTFEGENKEEIYGTEQSRSKILNSTFINETFETTEAVTHRDSSGRIIATSEKPVTKVRKIPLTELLLCFPSKKVLNQKSKYLTLKILPSVLWGKPSATVVAAWKLR